MGFVSSVMSKIRTICRISWHSFGVVSPMTAMKSFTLPVFCLANSGSCICSSGKAVCAPTSSGKSSLRNDRIPQVFLGRLLGSVQQLFAIDNFHDAIARIAVSEVDAIAFRSGGNGAVQALRRGSVRAGLLPGRPKLRMKHRLGGIAQIVDLRHARRAPADRRKPGKRCRCRIPTSSCACRAGR